MLSTMSWYVVHVGRQTGVFSSWEACHAQVDGFSGACYRKYRIREEVFAAFYGTQDGTKVTNAATHVTTAAPNINRTPFTRKNAIIVVMCAMLLVQAVAIVFLITKLM